MDATPFNRINTLPLSCPPVDDVRMELRSAVNYLSLHRLHNSAKW